MASTLDTVRKTVSDNYHDLSKGGQVVKKIILASNALVMLFGLLLVIVGGVAAGGQINALTSTTLASGIIVIGVFVMLIALLGCWGAMTENKILLYIYFALLIFFAIVEFAVGIAAYVKKDDLPEYTSQLWTTLYTTDPNGVNDIENSLQCCGWYNYSDRSVPPLGNEPSCSSLSPGAPSCSNRIFQYMQDRYGDPTDPNSRLMLQYYQKNHSCCGWTTLVEQPPSYWYPWEINSSTTCQEATGFQVTCYNAEETMWYTNFHAKTPVGDEYIVNEQNNWGLPEPGSLFGCCGWVNTTDAAIPPYSNNTCYNTKSFTTPCSTAVDQALANSLQITGGVGIALGILEIATIILTLVLIIKIPGGSSGRRGHDDANEGVMEELHDEE